MKQASLLLIALLLLTSCSDTKKEPWSSDQLMPPKELAQKIENDQVDSLLILSIGFDALIKDSKDMGAAENKKNVAHLKSYLSDVPKDKAIVIYCGCCPFEKCPNIRPAFEALNEMGFTNAKLLNLKTSIKADWLDEDYPVSHH